MFFEVEGVCDVARNSFVTRAADGNEIFFISGRTLFVGITIAMFHY